MKIYADTSVFGGVFDEEFSEPSRQFFDEVDAGRFVLVTSAVVEAEIEPAPERIRIFFARYAESASIADASQEALDLQVNYIKSGVVIE
jgi:predicted nucleic acid-binding protein